MRVCVVMRVCAISIEYIACVRLSHTERERVREREKIRLRERERERERWLVRKHEMVMMERGGEEGRRRRS